MARPKLSICIPTYNRAESLQKTLSDLLSIEIFPFDYEIVVSDNCSTDETPRVVSALGEKCGRIRYLRQTRTVSLEGNINSVFRMAAGEYALYHADDDMLIPDAVASVVRYLEHTPNVVACYAPWERWNEVTKASLGLAYSVEQEVVFGKKDSINLFDFIIHKHVFPKIAVYRSSALHRTLYVPHSAHWAFVCLARLLNCGSIAFLPCPFYRKVAIHRDGERREQFENKRAMGNGELYRGGLEYLLYKTFRNLEQAPVSGGQCDAALKMIGEFIAKRFSVALRCLVSDKDFISANELFWRLLVYDSVPAAEVSECRRFLAPRAAAQSLVETFEAVASVESIGLYSVSDPKIVRSLLLDVREDLPVEFLSDEVMPPVRKKDKVLVLAGNHMERDKLLKMGFKSGLVIVESDLLAQFSA